MGINQENVENSACFMYELSFSSFQGSRLMGHIAPVNSVDFASGNSDYLVTSGRDRAVKIWQWRSKTVKLNIDLRKCGRGTGLLFLCNYFVSEISNLLTFQ